MSNAMMFKVCEGCENYVFCNEYQRICSSNFRARVLRRSSETYYFKDVPGVEEYKTSYIMEKGHYIATFKYKSGNYEIKYIETKKPSGISCTKKFSDKILKLSLSSMKEINKQYGILEKELSEFEELMEKAKIKE